MAYEMVWLVYLSRVFKAGSGGTNRVTGDFLFLLSPEGRLGTRHVLHKLGM